MPGESSGFACRASVEQSNNIRVGKVHFLDMTTPFERAGSGTGFMKDDAARATTGWTRSFKKAVLFSGSLRALRMPFQRPLRATNSEQIPVTPVPLQASRHYGDS